jgi:hypothetical protein
MVQFPSESAHGAFCSVACGAVCLHNAAECHREPPINAASCPESSEIEAITRQWMRLGLHLELSQLLGIFYSHIGFYMNQALVNRATKAKRERLDACRVI